MLEETYQTPKQTPRDFKVIPEGLYQVVLEDVVPVETEFKGEKSIKLRFQFVILDEGEFAGERLFLKASQTVSNWNNNPSWLYRLISIFRSEPTEEEKENGVSGSMLNSFIGRQALVMVNNSQSQDGSRTFSNIKGITKAKVELAVPKLSTKGPVMTPKIEASDVDVSDQPPVNEEDADFLKR